MPSRAKKLDRAVAQLSSIPKELVERFLTGPMTQEAINAAGLAFKQALICWSIQEIRRIAVRLARRRIQAANIIAWSLWRRAHQASARKAHLSHKLQL